MNIIADFSKKITSTPMELPVEPVALLEVVKKIRTIDAVKRFTVAYCATSYQRAIMLNTLERLKSEDTQDLQVIENAKYSIRACDMLEKMGFDNLIDAVITGEERLYSKCASEGEAADLVTDCFLGVMFAKSLLESESVFSEEDLEDLFDEWTTPEAF